jgi:hypothetical protein
MRAGALENPGGALVESEDGVAVGVGRAASRRGAASHPGGGTATPVRRQRSRGRSPSSARTDAPAGDETQATSPHRRRPAVPVACGGCRRASGPSLRYGVGMAKDRRYEGLEISQLLRNLIFDRASELA